MPLLPSLTRPTAQRDRSAVLKIAEKIGQVELLRDCVEYDSPMYECEALAATGVCAHPNWRRADLLLIRNPSPIELPHAGETDHQDVWENFVVGTQVVRLRLHPIPSPDHDLTPSYYSGAKFPAWFRLNKIVEVDRSNFLQEFGDVPSLDPTMYEVLDGTPKRLIPSRNWDLQRLPSRGGSILHISDLHFGEGHGYPTSREEGRGIEVRPLAELLSAAIQDHVKVPIGAVVASGDFISKGNANSYPDATEFLRDLLARLKLDQKYCILVPGNHDLWTFNVEHPTRSYGHEKPYRMFLGDFRREEIQDLESVTRIELSGSTDVVFIALNSARIRNDKLKEYGYVSRHRYDDLLKYVNGSLRGDRSKRKTLIFAVLHHHIIPINRIDVPQGERPVSLTLDAGELIEEFCKGHVGYVLHGHQHAPFVGSVSRMNFASPAAKKRSPRSLYVLASGSTGARRDWLSEEIGKNIFSVYTPRRDQLEVQLVQFSAQERSSVLWNGTVPLQNFYNISGSA
jgi:3',5'-cyclic AMP phosphodiesterase CpdA